MAQPIHERALGAVDRQQVWLQHTTPGALRLASRAAGECITTIHTKLFSWGVQCATMRTGPPISRLSHRLLTGTHAAACLHTGLLPALKVMQEDKDEYAVLAAETSAILPGGQVTGSITILAFNSIMYPPHAFLTASPDITNASHLCPGS